MNGPDWLNTLALSVGYLFLACIVASLSLFLVVFIPAVLIEKAEDRRRRREVLTWIEHMR